MRRVLVIGASGFCGEAFAQELLRSGHYQVYGATRDAAKAPTLQAKEITPVIGSASNPQAYVDVIREKLIDTVVDISQSTIGAETIINAMRDVGQERLEASGGLGPKLGFIYVSGTWVHGAADEHDIINDLMPLRQGRAPELVAWRPEIEQKVLESRNVLDVAIVRPALVYGRHSTVMSTFLSPIADALAMGVGQATVKAKPDSRICLVHVDDVASGIRAAVDKLPLIAGTGVHPVFDLVTSSERIAEIIESGSKALGFGGGIIFAEPDDARHIAMSTQMNVISTRAVQILGWQPTRIGWARHAPVHTAAWLAATKQELMPMRFE